MFKCPTCGKSYIKKYNYDRHLSRTILCKPILVKDIKTLNTKYKCPYCTNTYTRKSNLHNHIKCHEIEILKTKEEEEQKILAEKQMEELIKTIENRVLNNLLQNYELIPKKVKDMKQTVDQSPLKLIPFGKEELGIIPHGIIKYLLSKGFASIIELIKYIHFNKTYPQFHNCYISNKKDNYCLTYDGNKWVLVEIEGVIEDLRTTGENFLENKFGEFKDELTDNATDKFAKFLKEKGQDIHLETYKKTIKLLLYNNREIVEETRNLLKGQKQ